MTIMFKLATDAVKYWKNNRTELEDVNKRNEYFKNVFNELSKEKLIIFLDKFYYDDELSFIEAYLLSNTEELSSDKVFSALCITKNEGIIEKAGPGLWLHNMTQYWKLPVCFEYFYLHNKDALIETLNSNDLDFNTIYWFFKQQYINNKLTICQQLIETLNAQNLISLFNLICAPKLITPRLGSGMTSHEISLIVLFPNHIRMMLEKEYHYTFWHYLTLTIEDPNILKISSNEVFLSLLFFTKLKWNILKLGLIGVDRPFSTVINPDTGEFVVEDLLRYASDEMLCCIANRNDHPHSKSAQKILKENNNKRLLSNIHLISSNWIPDTLIQRNCSGLSTEPTFRGLSAESRDSATSLDPEDKPRDVGREKVVTIQQEKCTEPEYVQSLPTPVETKRLTADAYSTQSNLEQSVMGLENSTLNQNIGLMVYPYLLKILEIKGAFYLLLGPKIKQKINGHILGVSSGFCTTSALICSIERFDHFYSPSADKLVQKTRLPLFPLTYLSVESIISRLKIHGDCIFLAVSTPVIVPEDYNPMLSVLNKTHLFTLSCFKEHEKYYLIHVNKDSYHAPTVSVFMFDNEEVFKLLLQRLHQQIEIFLSYGDGTDTEDFIKKSGGEKFYNATLSEAMSKKRQKIGNCTFANVNICFHLMLASLQMKISGESLLSAYLAVAPDFKKKRDFERAVATFRLLNEAVSQDKIHEVNTELECLLTKAYSKDTELPSRDLTLLILRVLHEKNAALIDSLKIVLESLNRGSSESAKIYSFWREKIQIVDAENDVPRISNNSM